MNLKNKKIEELWDMLDKIKWDKHYLEQDKYDIHKEIIRRERDNVAHRSSI